MTAPAFNETDKLTCQLFHSRTRIGSLQLLRFGAVPRARALRVQLWQLPRSLWHPSSRSSAAVAAFRSPSLRTLMNIRGDAGQWARPPI